MMLRQKRQVKSARAQATFPDDDNEPVMRAIWASMLLGAVQGCTEEVSPRIATRAVDVEVFEEVAHLRRFKRSSVVGNDLTFV